LAAGFLAATFFGAGLPALDVTAFLAMMFFELLFSVCGMIGFPAANGIMCLTGDIVNDRSEIIFAHGGRFRREAVLIYL
jgi:hypothetical protein